MLSKLLSLISFLKTNAHNCTHYHSRLSVDPMSDRDETLPTALSHLFHCVLSSQITFVNLFDMFCIFVCFCFVIIRYTHTQLGDSHDSFS